MHDDREFASDCCYCTLEDDLLAQLHASGAKIAVSLAAGENDDGCFANQRPHMRIATWRDMAVIIDPPD